MTGINFPVNPSENDLYSLGNRTWRFNGYSWQIVSNPAGYTGSQGYTGSKGDQGYTGSQGDQGTQGPIGYTGSSGSATGFLRSNVAFPTALGDADLGGGESPFVATTDAFGMPLGDLYDMMEPYHTTVTYNYGTFS
jgi:hypothetical protein